MTTLGRTLRAFGKFWWEFMIGDAPEFLAAAGVVVVLALLLRHYRGVASVVVPLTAIVLLVVSTFRAAKQSRGPSG